MAEGLSDGYHKVRIVKATEMQDALWSIISFEADGFATVTQKSNLKIEFVGDSISAGYGVIGAPGEPKTVENSDCTKSYTILLQKNSMPITRLLRGAVFVQKRIIGLRI